MVTQSASLLPFRRELITETYLPGSFAGSSPSRFTCARMFSSHRHANDTSSICRYSSPACAKSAISSR